MYFLCCLIIKIVVLWPLYDYQIIQIGQRWTFFYFCRGGTESTRQATHLINALIKDPDKEIDELIPKNRLKASANSKAAPLTSAAVTSASSSVMGIKITPVTVSSSQAASSLAVPAISQASAHKPMKNPVNNVRPGFPVSLPLAYPPPQFAHALLAAQTFQQIRPPRLPMTHFGGPFPPAQSTWGPFPVRPLSPARATNSPKSHVMPRHANQNLSSPQVIPGPPSSTSPTATTNSAASVPVSSTNGSLNSPSVRRQLFVTVVKTPNATTTTVTTTASNHITTPTASTCPVPTAKEHHTSSSPSSPSPPSLPGGGSRNSPSDCLTCSPNKGTLLSSDQDLGNHPVMEINGSGSSKQVSSTSGSTTAHTTHQHPPTSVSQDSRSTLMQTQVPPHQDPRMAPSHNLAVSGPTHQPSPITSNIPTSYNLSHSSISSTQSAAKMESSAARPPLHGSNPTHKSQVPVQNSSVSGLGSHTNIKRPQSVPSGPHPSSLSTQSSAQNSGHSSSKPMANFSTSMPYGPFSTLFENGPNPSHPFWGGSMVSSPSASDSMLSAQQSYLPNPESMLPSDTSKAPGFRPPMQRPTQSQSGKFCLLIS